MFDLSSKIELIITILLMIIMTYFNYKQSPEKDSILKIMGMFLEIPKELVSIALSYFLSAFIIFNSHITNDNKDINSEAIFFSIAWLLGSIIVIGILGEFSIYTLNVIKTKKFKSIKAILLVIGIILSYLFGGFILIKSLNLLNI